ncbi:hypothetical protein VCHE16_3447 [Vibrio paracholerae HE-16]|nr:hypothetical protein VCHE16_3447 [Vibrio paracholerae HE-16]
MGYLSEFWRSRIRVQQTTITEVNLPIREKLEGFVNKKMMQPTDFT